MVKALGEGQDQGADPLDLAFIKYRPGDEYSEDLYLPAATQRERERQRTRPSQAEAEDANARRRLEGKFPLLLKRRTARTSTSINPTRFE